MGRISLDINNMKFTPEELRECYVGKHMNQRAIARLYHVDVAKVRYAMQIWGIPVRTPGERIVDYTDKIMVHIKHNAGKVREKRPFSLKRYPFTEEDLHDCRINKRMSMQAIARKYGMSFNQIRYAIRMLDMRTRESYLRRTTKGEPIDYLDWHYNAYQKDAFIRSHDFDLSRDHFKELVTQPCYYCGIPPSSKKGKAYFNGIDRIDSSKGYIEGNVRPCCGNCNLGKRRMSEEEFVTWVLRVADHMTKKIAARDQKVE